MPNGFVQICLFVNICAHAWLCVCVVCYSQDCEVDSFTEAQSSVSEKSVHPPRDHSYSYDRLGLLSATSESMSMNYWSPVSQPLTYFHPMLSPPAAISLAPQVPCRALEMRCCFMSSPLTDTRITPAHTPRSAERLTHKTDVATETVYRHRRSSLPSVFTDVPLNLTVSASVNLHCALDGTMSRQTVDTLLTSRPSSGTISVTESALLLASNPASYVPSAVSGLFKSGPLTETATSVSVPLVSGDGDGVFKRLVLDRHPLIVSTAPVTGTVSDVVMSQMSAALADVKQMTVDAATSQHRDTAVHDVERFPSSSELFSPHTDLYFHSPDVAVTPKPTTAAIANRAISDQMPVTTSVVKCLVQESLQPPVVSSSFCYAPLLQGDRSGPVASSLFSVMADTVVQYPQPSQVMDTTAQYFPQSQVSHTVTQYPQLSQVSDIVTQYPQLSPVSHTVTQYPQLSQVSVTQYPKQPQVSETVTQYPPQSQVSDIGTQYPQLSQVSVTQYPKQPQVSDTVTQYPQLSQVSDTVAQYPQPSDISELLPQELQSAAAAQALPCPVSDGEFQMSSLSVRTKDEGCDILQSRTAATDVYPIKMEVDAEVAVCPSTVKVESGDSSVEQCSRALGSAAVESSLCGDDQLLVAPMKQDSAASSDEVTDVSLALAGAVQNSAPLGQAAADDAIIKPARTVTGADTGQQHDLSLLDMASEQCAEVSTTEPSLDNDAVQKSFSEIKPDLEPGFDGKESLNALDAGSKAADVEMVADDTPVSAIGTAYVTPSDDVDGESQPVSKPGSAAVAMEVSTPAASASQQHSTPAVVMDSNAGDAATSTASTETDKNERFKELMIKCTKALELCLARFPQHYKSLYRLADVFYRCSCLKVSHFAYIYHKSQ